MNNNRISVIVITYNQEEVINRALDSILCQKEYGLYEIIVCDDCSTDNTYKVVKDYSRKYPDIVKPYRNEHNLGIYGNCENALTKLGDTDLVIFCSGDDALCDGYLKSIESAIKQYNIDLNGESFTIYSDWKAISPNKEEHFYYNNLISAGIDPKSLKLRGLIFNRSICSSANVYKSFTPVPLNRGVSVAEGLFDIQVQIHTKISYYYPFIGSIYYTGIGVSTHMNDNNYTLDLIESLKEYEKMGIFSKKDIMYIKYQISRLSYSIDKSFYYFLESLRYYLCSRVAYDKFNILVLIKDIYHMIILRH